ncbi:MAG: hypothetical protein FWH07_00605 [Oscillospiraceae bacterium]|nr:hypothetical protein [Oscillospiraceae bacterium]
MRLAEWVFEPHEENESLDIFLQIVRLLHDLGKGAGTVSPAFYEIDDDNDVTFVDSKSFGEFESPEDYSAPESANKNVGGNGEKRDVFSLGILLHFILYQKLCPIDRNVAFTGKSFLKSRKKVIETSAIKADDSKQASLLMERMSSYNPESRPTLKEILAVLQSNMCRFGIVRENVLSKERYTEIIRCFSERDSYRYTPEKEYTVDLVTIAPLSCEPLLIPFRLVKKQYILPVAYGSEGRWHCAEKKSDAPDFEDFASPANHESASDLAGVHKATAALYFCDAVYGIEGHTLFCETDGYAYQMGLYVHSYGNESKVISIFKGGEVVVPERLEARILSILRAGSKAVYDLFCFVLYGKSNPAVIKTINDLFPEAVRIYHLDDNDILKGASLYLNSQGNKKNPLYK